MLQARDDETLKESMRHVGSSDDVVALAVTAGHRFSADDLDKTNVDLAAEDLTKLAVRRAGFRVQPYGAKHWFGWK